jgi:CRP/FNR family cyclic AMP-dependent transcriptional regulator
MVKKKSKSTPFFDAGMYLETAGVKRKIVPYRKGQAIFSQGDAGNSVNYLQAGSVKITVSSSVGKEAIVALLEPGDFFGEGSISGQPLRVSTATAMGPVSALEIDKQEMIRVIHEEHDFSPLCCPHAQTQRSHRGGFGRSTFQFQREALGPSSFVNR